MFTLRMIACKYTCLLFVFLVLACASKPESPSNKTGFSETAVPPIPEAFRISMQPYQNSRSATLADWGPGGHGMVIRTRFAETDQIHFVAAPKSYRRQLTFLSESVMSASVCPDSHQKCIFFTQDSGGNEKFQIYRFEIDSMKIRQITDGNCQNDGIVWSSSGGHFVFSSNKRNGTDFDLYVHSAADSGPSRPLLSEGGAWSANDWAPDDKKILVSKYLSRTRSYLFVFDMKDSSLTALHDTTDTISQECGAWGPGGTGVFLTSDEGTDFRSLRFYDCITHQEKLLTAQIPWDVREIALSHDRKHLAFTINEHGFSRVYLMDTRTLTYTQIPGLPKGIIGGLRFQPHGDLLGMNIELPTHPEDVYSVNLKDFSLQQWTESETGGISQLSTVEPEVFNYPTWDSLQGKPRLIPCFYYHPQTSNVPSPTLIVLHGGPESQFWPSFSPMIQYLVHELGIAVLAPNVRGSGGYGKRYLEMDNGLHREDAVKDIGALLDWIAIRPELDSSRVAVMGGSYGGYLVLSAMTHYNQRLRAGIDEYGISNFITFLSKTSAYRRDLRRVEYGDERIPLMRDFLEKISPLTNAGRITKPLLIIQGANDPRVPLEESQQIANAVRHNGGTAWMFVAGDEGHGFRRISNRNTQNLTIAYFLSQFLLPKSSSNQ